MNIYHLGQAVRCDARFTDTDGNLVDPSTLVFKVEDPDGTETSYIYGEDDELVRESQGVYYVDVDGNTAGEWIARFQSTGTAQAAQEWRFYVVPSQFSG